MPDSLVTQIPAPRVPLIDARTGTVSHEWFRWFYDLFRLVGDSSFSLKDLQLAPPLESVADPSGAQALQAVGDLPQTVDLSPVETAIQGLQETPPPFDAKPFMDAVEALGLSPAGGGGVVLIQSGSGLTGGPITSSGSLAIDFASANTWTARQTFDRPNTPPVAFASLPATPTAGDHAMVNDALAPAFGVAVAAGGAVTIPVFYDGASWIVG